MNNDKDYLIEKVAAGLRNMDIKPAFFVFFSDNINDLTWENDLVCGIPIIFSYLKDNNECPFLPCFKNEFNMEQQIIYFERGYHSLLK